MAEHFEHLAIYRASATRVEPVEGEPEDLLGEGGGLQAAFEAHGRRVLVGVLRDPTVAAVRLADGDLEVAAERRRDGAHLIVRWVGETVIDEEVEIGPVEVSVQGPWFRPEPDSEVGEPLVALHSSKGAVLHAVADVGDGIRWFSRGVHGAGAGARRLRGTVPAIEPEMLGSRRFCAENDVRWAYVAGAMAGGIASVELVAAMARARMLAFFGAGGLPLEAVESAIDALVEQVGDAPWGANLLHNPAEPSVEEQTVDLYLRKGVRRVSASAYMRLTPAVLRYRLDGICEVDGRIECPNQVFAKVSRAEVARPFLEPAPAAQLVELVKRKVLTAEQARLARKVPVASALTVEADSGGHTDHRPLTVIFPQLRRLRDRVCREQGWAPEQWPVVGAAGGLGTPAAVHAAFAMGADFVVTGSVNQATREAGTSTLAKEMLAAAGPTDVTTGPAPDMFERGVRVQVLSRGAMYASRAQRLYELYRQYPSLGAIPEKDRSRLERTLFKRPLDEVWDDTRAYWAGRDPGQVAKADADPKHQMALTFRWYLGMSSRWAREGDKDRKRDFQVWCGPAMGAFNHWAQGTALEPLSARSVVDVAHGLMHGAAVHARVASARMQGLQLPPGADDVRVVCSLPAAEEPQ